MLDIIKEPWPWYVAGPLIGLTVPILLILGNKSFGISSSLRHICAACIPGNINFFKYDWRRESWNLFFVLGIFFGGVISAYFLVNAGEIIVNPKLKAELAGYGITDYSNLVPTQLRLYNHGCRRIVSRLWNPLCGRMYKWSCYYGTFQSAVAISSGNNLFYDRWLFCGQCRVADYSFTIKNKQ